MIRDIIFYTVFIVLMLLLLLFTVRTVNRCMEKKNDIFKETPIKNYQEIPEL
jgi:ABC-type transport system involved in Fe-S cluster assembly fused permease/ATPase subunit